MLKRKCVYLNLSRLIISFYNKQPTANIYSHITLLHAQPLPQALSPRMGPPSGLDYGPETMSPHSWGTLNRVQKQGPEADPKNGAKTHKFST